MFDLSVKYKNTEIATLSASGTKTLKTKGKYCEDDIIVTYDKPQSPTFTTEEKTVTPTESVQEVTPTSADGLSKVTVNAIDSTYIGSGVAKQAAKTVIPSKSEQIAVDSGVYTTDVIKVGAIPSDYIVPIGTKSIVENGNGIDVTEYSTVDVNVPIPTFTTEEKTVNPTESVQTITPSSDGLSKVTVNAIESNYVGSGITKNPTPTVNGATVNIPSGYYSSDTSKSVTSGSLGTVSVSKGSVSNNSITVTPSISGGTAGYISETSKTGTGITVSASELVSGNKALTPSETAQNNIDVTNNATVSMSAISSTYVGSGISRKSSTDLTASGATVTVPSGYYTTDASKSVASGTAGTPSASKGTVSNNQVTVTPSVTNTTGYIIGGTKTGTGVVVKASDLVSGSQTLTENGTVDVTNLASVTVEVPIQTFITVRSGTSDPSSSLGSDGDIYMKV